MHVVIVLNGGQTLNGEHRQARMRIAMQHHKHSHCITLPLQGEVKALRGQLEAAQAQCGALREEAEQLAAGHGRSTSSRQVRAQGVGPDVHRQGIPMHQVVCEWLITSYISCTTHSNYR